jgi:hypothetical protein
MAQKIQDQEEQRRAQRRLGGELFAYGAGAEVTGPVAGDRIGQRSEPRPIPHVSRRERARSFSRLFRRS